MRSVTIYHRKDCLYLHANAKTEQGVQIAQNPGMSLADDAPAHIIGACIRILMNEFKSHVPHPKNWSEYKFPLLSLANVKGWKGFVNSCQSCLNVDEQDDGYCIDRMEKDGQGFGPGKDNVKLKIQLICSDSELGQAIFNILNK